MSTRSRRVIKAVSLPRITRRRCSKCGVVHEKPTGQKCKQVIRDSFTADLADENLEQVINRTSTPQNQGTVNRVISPIVMHSATGENSQTVAAIEGDAPINPLPTNDLGIVDKLDHLANAVSTLSGRLGSVCTEGLQHE